MEYVSEMKEFNIVALYGAILSTIIVVVGFIRFCIAKIKKNKEKKKFKTDLYYLLKIDQVTKEKFPIVVILLANLGSERITIKGIEYSGYTRKGIKTEGSPGWYEQPEEAYGIRKRLLPIVLESGETKDLPMLSPAIFENTDKLKIKLFDFDDKEYFIEQCDIEKINREIEKRKIEKNI